MSIPLDTLEAEVLKLPAGARSRLLDRLIASLEADADIEEAWAFESERRDAEVDELPLCQALNFLIVCAHSFGDLFPPPGSGQGA